MNTKRAADDAVGTIAAAAKAATATIAAAALDATKLLAANATEAAKISNAKTDGDHDTLTTLVASVANLDAKLTEKFVDLKSDIKNLNDGTSSQINNHENRLNALETSKTKQNVLMSIGIGILTLLTSILIYHIVNSIPKL